MRSAILCDLAPLVALAERAPLPVALPIEQLLDGLSTRRPRFRHLLFDICIAVESAIRFLCDVAVVELANMHGGTVPKAMRRPLWSLIEVPTFGAWREILRTLSTSPTYESRLMPEFPVTARALLRLCDGIAAPREDSVAGPWRELDIVKVRNVIAHGGGISDAQVRETCDAWMGPLAEVARQAAWLEDLQLWTGGDTGSARLLRGADARGARETPPTLLGEEPLRVGAVALCRPALQTALLLAPIQRWAAANPPDGDLVLHTFARLGNVGLVYDLIGATGALQVEGPTADRRAFEDLFSVPSPLADPRETTTHANSFEREVLVDARRPGSFVGRANEWEQLRAAVHSTIAGVLWVWGVAGVGKSALLTQLAATLIGESALSEGAAQQETMVLVYRFRDGDYRCNRARFLTWLKERTAPVATTETDERPASIRELARIVGAQLAGLGNRHLTLVVDGLDELTRREPQFLADDLPALVKAGSDRVLWIIASRDEAPIREAMTAVGAVPVFGKGLPPMHAANIRALIDANSSHLAVRTLLRYDEEVAGGVANRYVERLAERSEGLPHYLRLVLGDIARGHLTLSDLLEAERLPQGIERYFTQLCSRDGLGDSATIPSLVVALLALTGEALSVAELTSLVNRLSHGGDARSDADIHNAILAVMSLLKASFTTTGEAGYRLFHLEFEQFVRSDRSWQITRGIVRSLLIAAARAPGKGPDAGLLYRRGVALLIAEGQGRHARDLLCDPHYQVERLACRPLGAGDAGIIGDWFALSIETPPEDADARTWCKFWLLNGHKLRTTSGVGDGIADWLLATSVYPSSSPIGEAYNAIAEAYEPAAPYLEIMPGSRTKQETALLATLSGHEDSVVGARELSNGRLLSWSSDRTLRLWDRDGRPMRVLEGHADGVLGAQELPDGRLLSRSSDGTLRLWRADGRALSILAGHAPTAVHVQVLSDGRILSWAGATLRLWDSSGQLLMDLVGHVGEILGARGLTSGRLLSWEKQVARLWSSGGQVVMMSSIDEPFLLSPREVPGGNLLFWTRTHRVLRDAVGELLEDTPGDYGVNGTELPDGTVVAAADGFSYEARVLKADGTIIREQTWPCILEGIDVLDLGEGRALFWSHTQACVLVLGTQGEILRELPGTWVSSAIDLESGHFVTNPSFEGPPEIWSPEGTRVGELSNGSFAICQLSDSRLLARRGPALELWSTDSKVLFASQSPSSRFRYMGFAARQLRSGDILCSGGDHALVLSSTGELRAVMDATGSNDLMSGCYAELEDGHLLSWSWNNSLLLWNRDGIRERQLSGHRGQVWGACQLLNGRILSWSLDGDLRLWSSAGEPLREVRAEDRDVFGALELRDGRLLAWTAAKHGDIGIWSPQGDPIGQLSGHRDRTNGVVELSNGCLLSWSADKTLKIWSPDGSCLRTLEGHSGAVIGVRVLSDGRILSCAGDEAEPEYDDTARLWTPEGAPIGIVWRAGPVRHLSELADGGLLLGSDQSRFMIRTADGHETGWFFVDGMLPLAEHRFVAWKEDILQILTVDVDANSYSVEREWRPGAVKACFPPPSLPT